MDGLPVPQRYFAVSVLIMGMLLCVIDGQMVNLALPIITHDFKADPSHGVWVINAYQLCILTMLLPMATLADRIGLRRVYLGGIALFAVASVGCGLATSLPMLGAARAIQGLGAAGVMGVNAALVRMSYPKHLLGRGIALNSMTVATGAVLGPTIGAAILSVAPSWHWMFGVQLPLGMLVVAMGLRALPKRPGSSSKGPGISTIDVVMNVAMFALLFLGAGTLSARAGASPMAHALPLGLLLLAAGIVVGYFYMQRQKTQAAPMFPLDLLRIPLFRLSVLTGMGAFAAQMGAFITLPFLLLGGYGLTPLQTGLLFTCWPISIVLMSPVAGVLIGKIRAGVLCGTGMGIMAVGLLLLAMLPARPTELDIAWRMVVCGLGFGFFQAPNSHSIMTSGPVNRSGAAGGMVSTARLTGQSIGAMAIGIVFSAAGAQPGHGTTYALLASMCFALVAGVFSVMRLRH